MMSFFFNATLRDWSKEAQRWQEICRVFQAAEHVRIVGQQTDITFSTKGRIYEVADGHKNMPDGEIFTCPVDDSAEGQIYFEFPGVYMGQLVSGIRLELKQGAVVRATADLNEELLLRLLDMDEGSRHLGEFGVGVNLGIDRFSYDILYDEKIGGTIHLALGRAYAECNGVNQSALHWDIIKDLRGQGEIYLDGTRVLGEAVFSCSDKEVKGRSDRMGVVRGKIDTSESIRLEDAMHESRIKILLATLMIVSFVLVSCQPAAAPQAPAAAPTEAPAAAPTEAPAAAPTQAPAAAAPVEITYMRQAENGDIELDFVKEFEAKNPNIKVNVDSVPANDNYNKLVLTTNAGNPPDVFMSFWTASAVSAELIYPLDEFVNKDDFNKRFTTAGQSYAKFQGKIYAIPWRAGASVFLVNCKMFEDAGVDVPKLGWTWDDLASISAKLTDKAKGTYGFAVVGSSTDFATEWQFWPFLLQAGGQILDDKGHAAFNSDAGVKALEYLISLKPSMPEGFTSMDLNQMTDLMVSNKLAMFEDGPWFIGIIQGGHPDFKVCVAPMTVGANPGNIAGGTALGMSPLSKHKEEAWKFIDYMTSDDVLTRWNIATNNMPPNNAALEDKTYKEGPLAVAAEAVKQPGVIPANQYPDSDALNGIMRTYLQAAYLGQMTPKEALDKAAAEWNADLVKYFP